MKEHLKKYIDESKTSHVRGLRILLEYFYATEIFEKITRDHTKIISVFGSARTQPHSLDYRMAQELGALLYKAGFAVVTGASRGIMQAANQGVADEIARQVVKLKKAPSIEKARTVGFYKQMLARHSVGLGISLPMESENNPFVGVGATFHYFMVRKFFFGTLSSGFIACEGGWGTRDELFEILTLVQTGKSPLLPIVYLSSDPSHLAQDLKHTLKKQYISPADMDLIKLVKTPQEAAREVTRFYRNVDRVTYEKDYYVRIDLKKSVSDVVQGKVEKILANGDKSPLDIEWSARKLVLRQYSPHSYGDLRRAIDVLNG